MRAATAIIAGLALLWGWSEPATAAVRMCHQPVSSGLQVARTEQEARTLAIAAWAKAAAVHGKSYTSWRIANAKFFNCSRNAAGHYQCLATAEPCIISNVPPPPEQMRPPQHTPGMTRT